MDYVIFLFEGIPVWVKLVGLIVGLCLGLLNACWGTVQQVQQYRQAHFSFDRTRRGLMHGLDLAAGILWVIVVWLITGALGGFLLAVLLYLVWPAILWIILGVCVISGMVVLYRRRRSHR